MENRGSAKVAAEPELVGGHVAQEPAGAAGAMVPGPAAAEGAAAAPPHTGKYTEPESLIAAAEAGGTKLVSARWLVEFNRTRGEEEPIKRQQDLPADAFVDPADLRAKGITTGGGAGKYIILAVSYCWLTPKHPDPKGQQIDTLAFALSLMLDFFRGCVDIATFLDYSSLPQEPRGTPEESAAFKMGLKDVNLWYAHKLTRVFLLTKFPAGWPEVTAYADRGWPSFERRISSLVKDSLMCLDLGLLEGSETQFAELYTRCKHGRCAPQAPDAFAEAVGRLHFTNGADTAFVQAKYRQTAQEVLADVESLDFSKLGWGDPEVNDLAQVLTLAPRLKTLFLHGNKIGDEGASALAGALPDCPSLQELLLYTNNISDAGALELARALPSCPALQRLFLDHNGIGESGCKALQDAAAGRQLDLLLSDQKAEALGGQPAGCCACALQ